MTVEDYARGYRDCTPETRAAIARIYEDEYTHIADVICAEAQRHHRLPSESFIRVLSRWSNLTRRRAALELVELGEISDEMQQQLEASDKTEALALVAAAAEKETA